MKKAWWGFGRVLFWLSWPVLFVYLHGSERTRLLLVNGDEILVVKNWFGSGSWSLPGGGLHRGEDYRLGALRELREEVGLNLSVGQLRLLISSDFHDRGFRFHCHYYLVYLNKPVALRLQRFEIITAEWLDYRNLDNSQLGVDVQTALKAMHNLNLLQ